MKRYALMLVATPIILIVLVVSFFIWKGLVSDFSKYGQDVAALILAFMELLVIVAGMILLHQYFRDHRPHRFLFEGFSNEADVLKAEQKPVNLSKLAQEELANQFEELYDQLVQYSNPYRKPMVILPNVEKSSSLNIGIHLPPLNSKDTHIQQVVDALVEKLRDIVKILGSASALEASANALENIAPQGVGPIMPLFDMLVAPDVVKVTGYLQYKDDGVGITLELANPRHHKPLIHTFWQKKKVHNLPVKQRPIALHKNDGLVPYYINILGPAMRWLMLQIWEKDISQRTAKGEITSNEQKNAVMLCLLGALYYASADQFEEHKRFFLQSAANCFQEAMNKQKLPINWWVPYLYLANIYRFEMQSVPGAMREVMFDTVLDYYNCASKYAENQDEMIRDRIVVDKAITILMFGSDEQIKDVAQCVTQVRNKVCPYYFDEKRADNVILLLYSLATWCQVVYDKYANVEAHLDEPDKTALYYLAAALVHSKHPFSHSEYLWETANIDQNFEAMRKEGYLKKLEERLSKKLGDYPNVVKWKEAEKEKDFKTLVDDTVKEVYGH